MSLNTQEESRARQSIALMGRVDFTSAFSRQSLRSGPHSGHLLRSKQCALAICIVAQKQPMFIIEGVGEEAHWAPLGSSGDQEASK